MGNDNKDKVNLDEIIDEASTSNNPFVASEDETEIKVDEEITNNQEKIIDELKAENEKINNQYIRLAADFDNYRKRQAQERESLLKYGAQETLTKMIEALDNIDRAKKSVENIEDVNTVKESYELVFKQIFDVLNKIGLEVIETEGKEFDPNFHEAVMQTPTSEYPENAIISELQKGYKLSDRVLRPSLVNVAVSE